MELENKTIYFRLADPSDAAFILSLRVDGRYNKYLSSVDHNVDKQREWLVEYKKRELLNQEYYFIVHRKSDSLPIGTVRVYDFIKTENSFCWGSWILNENKTRYAALECALIIYDFAFLRLGFKLCHNMVIRRKNLSVLEFHKRFGVKIVDETDENYIGNYSIDDYLSIRSSIVSFIEANNSE